MKVEEFKSNRRQWQFKTSAVKSNQKLKFQSCQRPTAVVLSKTFNPQMISCIFGAKPTAFYKHKYQMMTM